MIEAYNNLLDEYYADPVMNFEVLDKLKKMERTMEDKNEIEKMDFENILIPHIQIIILYASGIDLNTLTTYKDQLHSDLARYEALGIVDGHGYHKKVNTRRALLQRMEAIYNLAKVVDGTKDLIDLEAIKPKE